MCQREVAGYVRVIGSGGRAEGWLSGGKSYDRPRPFAS